MNLLVPPLIFPRRKVAGDMFAGGTAFMRFVPSGRISVIVMFIAVKTSMLVMFMV